MDKAHFYWDLLRYILATEHVARNIFQRIEMSPFNPWHPRNRVLLGIKMAKHLLDFRRSLECVVCCVEYYRHLYPSVVTPIQHCTVLAKHGWQGTCILIIADGQ